MNLDTEEKTFEGQAFCSVLERCACRSWNEVEEEPSVYRQVSLGIPLGVLTTKEDVE